MKNNKVLMSLVLASISAMAAAPLVSDSSEDTDGKLINLNDEPNSALPDDTREQMTKQLEALLMKKTSIQQLSESVSLLADSYGKNNESMKTQIFKELNLAASPYNQIKDPNSAKDSASVTPGAGTTTPSGGSTTSAPAIFCHAACHSACHTACHGARGWR